MTYLARVNPKYFAAIHQCAAQNDVRYYLNAVHIEPHSAGGVLIVATNGHFLGAIHDPDGWIAPGQQSLLIGAGSKRLLSACMARRGPDSDPPAVLWVAEKYSLLSSVVDTSEEPEMFGEHAHLTERTALVDGQFPNWRRVIPSARQPFDGQFPCINGEYLEAFNKIGVMLSGQKRFGGGGMHLEASAGHAQIVVRFNNHDLIDRFVGVIMPMYGDKPEQILPTWAMTEKQSGETQAA
ncbi:hypothetical protein [Pseudomonas typographi]|uniref:DNA polymerase III beta sliding clamp central domain-containing protein n=1 Tax=Pseudomonas typographi TaxID=2715964 RepID=A0ABR7Z9N2_9PSED|nr:hypothetical protein [Pseudomonas typographi]MBD1602269.1 hypothetical protein [Pseudomonas typographi]